MKERLEYENKKTSGYMDALTVGDREAVVKAESDLPSAPFTGLKSPN